MAMSESELSRASHAMDVWLQWSRLASARRLQPHWLDGGGFWFVDGAPENTQVFIFDRLTGVRSMYDVETIRERFQAASGFSAAGRGLPFTSLSVALDRSARFEVDGISYEINANGTDVVKVPPTPYLDVVLRASDAMRRTPRLFNRPSYWAMEGESGVPEMPSPDGQWLAGLQGFQLALRSTMDGRMVMCSTDGEARCAWDVESIRYGVAAGANVVTRCISPWSPDSLTLFVSKFDTRGVGTMAQVHYLKPFDEVKSIPLARTGDNLPTVIPYFYDLMTRSLRPIKIDAADCFLCPIGWKGDGGAFFLALFSRDCRLGRVLAINRLTGEATELFSERGDTFIRIQHDVIAGRSGCRLLPSDRGFLWESERDGWRHLYRYDLAGQCIGPVTGGEWPVADVMGVDDADGWVYFTAHHDQLRPYDLHLCRAPLGGGEVKRLTQEPALHEIQLAPDFSSFVATASRADASPFSEVRCGNGDLLHRFAPLDLSSIEAMGWQKPEQFVVKAADGESDLWGVLYKPTNFDPQRKYPVIECIYGGPQVSYVPHHFPLPQYKMAALNQALSHLGYVIVVLDARGTPERSKQFQDVAFKDWRKHVTADHAAGLRQLAADRPWIDLERVGVWGFSWGGYFTVASLLDSPDLYTVGVAVEGGYSAHGVFIYEPYLGGIPATHNKVAYDDADLTRDAHRLRGKLMLIAGTNDMPAWHNTVVMSESLIRAHKQHEFVVMPGQPHGFDSVHEDYFIEKLVTFFSRYLKH